MLPPRGAALQRELSAAAHGYSMQHCVSTQLCSRLTCRWGRMIWAEEALLVLGRGWLRMHMARTTREVRRTFSG